MVEATFRKSAELILGFDVQGHADSGPHGQDLVCAAVSVLVQTALKSLVEVAGISENALVYTLDEGHVRLEYTEALRSERAQVILESLLCGLRGVEGAYGSFLTIKEDQR